MTDLVPIAILVVIALLIGFLLGRRREPCSETIYLPNNGEVKFGETKISQIYSKDGDRALIGFLDAKNAKAFVSSDQYRERVKSLLSVKTEEDDTWVIDYPTADTKYGVVQLEAFVFEQSINENDVFLMRDYYCKPYKSGTCINFVDKKTRKFLYSWKAVTDTGFCVKKPGKDCKEILQENKANVYPKRDCKGKAYTKKVSWRFCTPT